MGHVYLNGRILPETEAHLSIRERGFLYGDGVFETLRAYRGRPHALAAHLARLRRSCELTGIPYPGVAWERVLADLLAADGLSDARIRITVTRGMGGGFAPPERAEPTVLAAAAPIPYGPELHERGVAVVTTDTRKIPADCLDPRIKSLAYLPHVLARGQAERAGAFEGLLLGQGGEIVEATTSNLFAVVGDRVLTPPLTSGILDGITRAEVIPILRDMGLTVEETPVFPGDLLVADEIFLTGSVIEVLPVVRLDGAPVGSGEPGPVAQEARRRYRDAALQGL